jgi:hypothetical protein
MQNPRVHDSDSTPRLIARIVREVLRGEPYERYADLIDAVKTRLSQLHVPYRPHDVTTAIGWIDTNTELLKVEKPNLVPPDRLVPQPAIVSREIAARILADLRRMNPTHDTEADPCPKTLTRR